jgi:uncharacterized protein YbcI
MSWTRFTTQYRHFGRITRVRAGVGLCDQDMEADSLPTLTGGQLNAALSRAIVQLHNQHLGRGPTKGHAFYRGSVVVVILEDTLTKAERSLIAAGKTDTVRDVRRHLLETMRPDLVAAVERLTGCRVVCLLADNETEPDVAAEVFVLDRALPVG